MTIAIVDSRITVSLENELRKYTDTVIKLPPFSALPSPVSAHPDMLIFEFDGTVYTWKDYLQRACNAFDALRAVGYKITAIEEAPSDVYPNDVRLNCAVVGKKIIAHKKHVSSAILELAHTHRLEILHTNQGYAKCSTVTVSENALITADESIYKVALSAGIDALKIRSAHIGLDGYDTGFIGGATGVSQEHVFFCGNVCSHPDANDVISFCHKHGKSAVSLTNEPLYDYGTVMLLQKN